MKTKTEIKDVLEAARLNILPNSVSMDENNRAVDSALEAISELPEELSSWVITDDLFFQLSSDAHLNALLGHSTILRLAGLA